MAETYFEQKEREAKEQQAREKQSLDYQAQQKEFADQYAKKQEELKALTPQQVQANVESVQTQEFVCIAQSHAKFQQSSPEVQQKMTAEYIPQDNREGASREEASRETQTRFSDQLPVEHSKTTNVASYLAQSAYERRMSYLDRDQQFAEQIEAEADPVKREHLTLQRDLSTAQYEMSTAHAASNVSRLVGDKENDVKFAAQATEHEVKRDGLEQRLREFEQAHSLGQYADKDQDQQQAKQETREMSEPKSAGAQRLEEMQQTENAKAEQAGVKPISADKQRMFATVRDEIKTSDQQRERSRDRDREQGQER